MALKDDIKPLLEQVRSHESLFEHNRKLFRIYEGELKPFVEEALSQQLSQQSFRMAIQRIPPINVLKRIVDKLSKIYQQNPTRRAVNGTDSDTDLLRYYEKEMRINKKMNISNEFFNLFKNNLVHIYANNQKPNVRAIPSDRFMVWSNDPVDPTHVTHVVTIQGKELIFDASTNQSREVIIYHAYTDEEFIIFDSEENLRMDLMVKAGNPEGINEYGKMPFVYVNRSENLLIPLADTDTLSMTILFPLLLTDLNFAVMFQAFSIIWGIDLTEDKLEMSPNAFWRLKSDDTPDAKPQIGVIKPQVDIQQVLTMIQAQLAFWLQSRGIRPGAVGQLTADNFASGISKMVDEMDTSEERQKQVGFYRDAEEELWDFVVGHGHPVWRDTGAVENLTQWSPAVEIVTDFSEQLPLLRRGDIVDELTREIEAGLTSKRRARQKLNPKMNEEELDLLEDEIQEEKQIFLGAEEEPADDMAEN